MRPLRILLPLVALIACLAAPAAAQVKNGRIDVGPTVSGSGGVAPGAGVESVSLKPAALNPVMTGSVTGGLFAPAISPEDGLHTSAVMSKAGVAAAKPEAKSVAALRGLGVPQDALDELAPLMTDRSSSLADSVESMSTETQEKPNRRVLLILAAALREAPPFEALTLADRIGAKFGFTDDQLIALSQPELHHDASAVFPAADQAWALSWIATMQESERSSRKAAEIRAKTGKAAEEEAGKLGSATAPEGESADVKSAKRYVNGIMAGIKPTERQIDSLLGDWLAENGIKPGSPRALAVRAALVPGKASADAATTERLDRRIRHRAALLLRVAAENGTTAERIEAVLKKREMFLDVLNLRDDLLETQILNALHAEELEKAVAPLPRNEAGELLRQVAQTMRARGGKSVEEIARDGVFVYADIVGAKLARYHVSRDPDGKHQPVVFYVTRDEGRWVLDVYRQNRLTGRADSALTRMLKDFLVEGGVPSDEVRAR